MWMPYNFHEETCVAKTVNIIFKGCDITTRDQTVKKQDVELEKTRRLLSVVRPQLGRWRDWNRTRCMTVDSQHHWKEGVIMTHLYR